MAALPFTLPKKKTLAGLGIATASFLLTVLLFRTPFTHETLGVNIFEALERKGPDLLMRIRGEREHTNNLMLVRIDEWTVNNVGTYPIPRDQVGTVMAILAAFGAKAVAFDIFLDPPTSRDSAETAVMIQLLAETPNDYHIIGPFIPSRTAQASISFTDVDSTAHYVVGRFGIPAPEGLPFPRAPYLEVYPFAELAEVTTGIGHAVIIPDSVDGIIRSVPLFVQYAGRLYPTLGLALAMNEMDLKDGQISFEVGDDGTTVHLGSLEIPTNSEGATTINFVGRDETIPSVSFYDVLEAGLKQDEEFLSQFRGKVCIIGPTTRTVGDYYAMPFSEQTPGYIAHANVYDMVMTDNFIHQANSGVQVLFLILLIGGIGFVAANRPMRVGILTLVGALVLYVLFVYFAFTSGNIVYNLIEPMFGMILCFVATVSYRAATEGKQRKMITNMFERYVDRTVVQQLIDDPKMLKLGGEMKEITLLFSDIKGFTTISEQLGPENLVKLINAYLTEMTGVIMKNRGTVDKFIGDAIMAFWGAPIDDRDAAFNSCRAALEMQSRLDAFAARWKKSGNIVLKQRVGINTGPCIVGNMGSESKFNYTAMGDAVNVASRLEGVNKQYGTYIMLSEVTYQKVASRVTAREIDKVIVMGKTEPIKIYELIGLADKPLGESMKSFLQTYREGLAAYQSRTWDEGIALMEHAMTFVPNDSVCTLYVERMRLYQLNPPDANWNGVFVLGSK
ncbi:MAG: adenylate/guanylate cyclase domain-containing protein [Ignavibacteriales bacterium]|nr:adenylate/guanylate cyclase domain-containing protein [Ignavibacteriales bacterium]